MLDPEQLFTVRDDVEVPTGLVLVHALGGFIDAGGGGRLAREHLLATLPAQLVAQFDVDQVLDYRDRRPIMLFVSDHWESYSDPQLAIHLVQDGDGAPFLLLSGPEPDYQWERFTTAVRLLVERFGVRLTVGFNAIPMGVPHTRPLGVTAHGTRPDLVSGYPPWVNTVQVPASAGNLLEFRLGEAGHDAIGFAAHVPHYLAQVDYPAAAVTLLDHVGRVAALSLPPGSLPEAAADVRQQVDAQVAESEEVAAVVRALESQYDAFVGAAGAGLLAAPDARLPTADELGAELERFLAQQSRPRDSPEGG